MDEDIRKVAARCVAAGGELIEGIAQVSPDDPGLRCTIRDPFGGMVGLIQVVNGQGNHTVDEEPPNVNGDGSASSVIHRAHTSD